MKRTFKKKPRFFEVLLYNESIEMYDSFVVTAYSEGNALEVAKKKANKGWVPTEARPMSNKSDLYYYNEGACYVDPSGLL